MSSTRPADEARFVEADLLPEMVHERCFCEAGSREFVEFESARVAPLRPESHQLRCALYRAELVVRFSGEPRAFRVLVKLLPESAPGQTDAELELAYRGFLNEEIACNKARLRLGAELYPKIYLADMGKYGRPVVVVEDLERAGYYRVADREFSVEEARAVLRSIGSFHGKGMALRQNQFAAFREFTAKFQEITFAEAVEADTRAKYAEFIEQLRYMTARMDDTEVAQTAERVLTSDPYAKCRSATQSVDSAEATATICQGLLLRENLWFRRLNGRTEVRALDWQRVRHGSCGVDLATVLAQCRFYDWKLLLRDYAAAVRREQPTLDAAQLEAGLASPGFPHAFLLLSLADQSELPPLTVLHGAFARGFAERVESPAREPIVLRADGTQ
ncbi:uncharacterized protein LOC131670608 [Phymastichus coffea]|uniref:uncharacterized protein LOC131670608 n=1 Tax=Phymastichus coffea TaxID=108790 RepID=UPI00273AD633|nr:uncharacterized protein LOC131670608 [Phymastichus coffea]